MRALESRSLTVLTTNTCTAACAHCSMNSSPTRRGKLTAEQICNYVDQAADGTRVEVVVFAGGEPMLLGEDLFRSLRHIRSRKLKSRVVTNAYWANSEKRALEIVTKLYEAGLDELNISIDDYHLPYIKAINVKRAFEAALKVDFQSLIIVHCKGVNTKFNDKELDELLGVELPRIYDENDQMYARKDIKKFPSKTFVAVGNSNLQFIGRSVVELREEDVTPVRDWETRSRELGGCRWAVRSPAISPSGRLLSCCGFEVAGNEILDLGDLETESMTAILDRADNDLILNMIALEGPYNIMDFLKSKNPDLPFRKQYSSFCELCQHIVTDPRLRKSLYENMAARAPEVVIKREAVLQQAQEDAEFDAMYHASDPQHSLSSEGV